MPDAGTLTFQFALSLIFVCLLAVLEVVALLAPGVLAWILFAGLTPFWLAVPATAWGEKLGRDFLLVHLLFFPVLRNLFVFRSEQPDHWLPGGSDSTWSDSDFSGSDSSGGDFSGGGGSFGGGGASGDW